jgi:hypothetical protein
MIVNRSAIDQDASIAPKLTYRGLICHSELRASGASGAPWEPGTVGAESRHHKSYPSHAGAASTLSIRRCRSYGAQTMFR